MSTASNERRRRPAQLGSLRESKPDGASGSDARYGEVGDDSARRLTMSITQPSGSLSPTTKSMPVGNEDEDLPSNDHEPISEEQLLPPAGFRPFFTLIEDPVSGEHYHPNVHYVFSDDEIDVLTPAALDAIEAASTSTHDFEERIVIVDMATDGKSVVKAESLSPHWQAVKIITRQAPSWGVDAADADKGLMLRVSGEEVLSASVKNVRQASGLEELVKKFGERLDDLDDILRVMDEPHEEEHGLQDPDVDEQEATARTEAADIGSTTED